ncbi:MAG TPA: hypothetical protein VIT20_01625 [Propionibacteriaceae bacterium]
MSDTTRRTFLALTGGGLAAGATLVAPEAIATTTPITETESGDPDGAGDDTLIVAYIQDPKSGRITVAVGDREFSFYDRDLTKKLGRLARQGKS